MILGIIQNNHLLLETEAIQYNTLSDITEEELNEFISIAEENLKNDFSAVSQELEDIYLSEYSGSHCLYFSYKITKEDNSEKYAYVEFTHAGRKPTGGIGYINIWDSEQDLSEGIYEVHDSLTRTLLDHMEYTN